MVAAHPPLAAALVAVAPPGRPAAGPSGAARARRVAARAAADPCPPEEDPAPLVAAHPGRPAAAPSAAARALRPAGDPVAAGLLPPEAGREAADPAPLAAACVSE